MIPDFGFNAPDQNDENKHARWHKIAFWTCLAHVAALFFLFGMDKFFKPKEEIPFKVKIGDIEPSTAPEVGQPSRQRPTPEPPTPEPEPAQPEPTPEPPAPEPPTPKAEPKSIPQPKPKPKPQPRVKPKPKPKPQPKVKPKKQTKKTEPKPKKNNKKSDNKKSTKNNNSKKTASNKTKPKNPAKNYDKPFSGGGSNFNPNVPIGDRDRGQKKGPVSNKTPAGGLTQDMEKYVADLIKFLQAREGWPSGILLEGQQRSLIVKMTITASGRVISKKITQTTGSPALDRAFEKYINSLDMVPPPPHGELTDEFEFDPRTE